MKNPIDLKTRSSLRRRIWNTLRVKTRGTWGIMCGLERSLPPCCFGSRSKERGLNLALQRTWLQSDQGPMAPKRRPKRPGPRRIGVSVTWSQAGLYATEHSDRSGRSWDRSRTVWALARLENHMTSRGRRSARLSKCLWAAASIGLELG